MKIKIECKELYEFNRTHTEKILQFALTQYNNVCNKYYDNANVVKKIVVAFKFPSTPAMFNHGEYLIDNKKDLQYAKYLRKLYFSAKGLKNVCKYIPNKSDMLWLDEFETDCYIVCAEFVGDYE